MFKTSFKFVLDTYNFLSNLQSWQFAQIKWKTTSSLIYLKHTKFLIKSYK